jgi:hypothetical protein
MYKMSMHPSKREEDHWTISIKSTFEINRRGTAAYGTALLNDHPQVKKVMDYLLYGF